MTLKKYLFKKHQKNNNTCIFIFMKFANQDNKDWNGLIKWPNSKTPQGKTATEWIEYLDTIIEIDPLMNNEIQIIETEIISVIIIG